MAPSWDFKPLNGVKAGDEGSITIYDVYRGLGKPISISDDLGFVISVYTTEGRISGVKIEQPEIVVGTIPYPDED